MAAKLGFEAIKYVFTKALTKKGSQGIARIPGKAHDMRMKELVDAMATKMRDLGYDVNKVTEKEVKGLLDSAEALEKQKTKAFTSQLMKDMDVPVPGTIRDESGRIWDFGTKDRPFPGWKPEVIKSKRGEFLKKYTKDGKPNDVELNALVTEHKILSEESKRLGEAGEKYGKFKDLNTRIDEIEEVLDFMKKEFPEPGDFASGGIARLGMAGGGALFKFIEKLFIKASNDIRQGKGKWKGLTQEQWIKQHDNLTKKVTEFQKTGKLPEGMEQYFDVNVDEAFAAAQAKVKKPKIKDEFFSDKDAAKEWDYEIKKRTEGILDEAGVTPEGVSKIRTIDERQLLKIKYPGISDDLLNKILIDDNPQRKADVLATMDQYLKLREVGKGEQEAFNILTKDMKKPTKHAEGGRASLMYGGDPGFAFEYGGSWADWHDQHRNTMPVEQYIQTKLPKARLPFREMQSGGLAYMLGEPTYSAGGQVGHAPWLKPTGQQQPQGQPQPQGGAQSPGRGQPNPMKAPQGLPSLAPRTMDPQYMQQQRMQQMMGQMGQQGQPRRGMEEGGMTQEDFDRYLRDRKQRDQEYFKEDFLDDFDRWKKHQKDRTVPVAEGGRIGLKKGSMRDRLQKDYKSYARFSDYLKSAPPKFWLSPEKYGVERDDIMTALKERFMYGDLDKAEGGRASFGLGSMSRRAFLKMMAAVAALPIVGKSITKVAPKAIPKVTETIARGADGMPTYITDLIEVVKAKGARDVIEGFKKSDYSNVHSYKGVDVIEDGAGNIQIKNTKQGSATDAYTGKSYEGPTQDIEMSIKKGDYVKNKKGKMVKEGDEYMEVTVRPDMDGKMKDMVESVDEADHLDFKKIADELHEDDFYYPLDAGEKLKGKASGGLAYMLGE